MRTACSANVPNGPKNRHEAGRSIPRGHVGGRCRRHARGAERRPRRFGSQTSAAGWSAVVALGADDVERVVEVHLDLAAVVERDDGVVAAVVVELDADDGAASHLE